MSAKASALLVPLLVLASLLCPLTTADGVTTSAAIINNSNPLLVSQQTSSTSHDRGGRGRLSGMITTGTAVGGACTRMTLRDGRRWRGAGTGWGGFTAVVGEGGRRRTWGSGTVGRCWARGRGYSGAGSLRLVFFCIAVQQHITVTCGYG